MWLWDFVLCVILNDKNKEKLVMIIVFYLIALSFILHIPEMIEVWKQ